MVLQDSDSMAVMMVLWDMFISVVLALLMVWWNWYSFLLMVLWNRVLYVDGVYMLCVSSNKSCLGTLSNNLQV